MILTDEAFYQTYHVNIVALQQYVAASEQATVQQMEGLRVCQVIALVSC